MHSLIYDDDDDDYRLVGCKHPFWLIRVLCPRPFNLKIRGASTDEQKSMLSVHRLNVTECDSLEHFNVSWVSLGFVLTAFLCLFLDNRISCVCLVFGFRRNASCVYAISCFILQQSSSSSNNRILMSCQPHRVTSGQIAAKT